MKVRWPGTIKVYNNGSSQAKHTGFQDKPWGHGHGKKKKNSSGFTKRCVQTLRPTYNFLPSKNIHQSSIYLLTGWVLAFWFCTGSGKHTDGNNLWLSFKSWRLLFLFSWFPLVPKMSFWSRVPAFKWNCCQHFITFSISGFLRANSSSKDSHALVFNPLALFIPPPCKGAGLALSGTEISSCTFPDRIKINTSAIHF